MMTHILYNDPDRKWLTKLIFFASPPNSQCLGLHPKAPFIEIEEGFIRIAYDVGVKPMNFACQS
jgi:hypothetical protein